eukprot:CAMPEP_0174229294 /NCGR_PEP_ID=MMETSP0417-20130205/303_1 /TAXON_ID=242541 /ORGANISM="Mayorella sp, Strain BSH-02190019" /LENGTH=976 /DNA_ID=CAMNT_0015306825 /DNA_START=93 /DNA_END=3023 /DNA_ORIENTATION=+
MRRHSSLSLISLLVLLLSVHSCEVHSQECQCISRSRTRIDIITHGPALTAPVHDPFWYDFQQAAVQAADGLFIDMHYKTTVEGTLNIPQLISLIDRSIAEQVAGVVLTLPSDHADFLAAARRVGEAGIPLLTVGPGSHLAEQAGSLMHLGQDDEVAGYQAGQQLAAAGGRQGLCVVPDSTQVDYAQRCAGFARALGEVAGSTQTLVVDKFNADRATTAIRDALQGNPSLDCFLAADFPVVAALDRALTSVGRLNEPVVAFEFDSTTLTLLSEAHLLSVYTQRQYLQAHLAVSFVTLGTTTLNLAANKMVRTGPVVLNQPDAILEQQACVLAGHPLCGTDPMEVIGGCSCFAREGITIKTFTHQVNGNPFWGPVIAGVKQAGIDLGINAVHVGNGVSIDIEAMANNIANAVVDDPSVVGVGVTVPDESLIVPALISVAASVPACTLNSGASLINQLRNVTNGQVLNHIGQPEYEAGLVAGARLAELGFRHVLCLNFEPTNAVLQDRCQGTGDALAAAGGDGMIEVEVPLADAEETRRIVLEQFAADSSLDSVIGTSNNPAEAAASLLESGQLPAGTGVVTFDVSAATLDLLENEVMLFAVHQQPYLQGYYPTLAIYLHLVTRGFTVLDPLFKTGPALVERADVPARRCEAEFFPQCPEGPQEVEVSLAARIALGVLAGLLILCCVALAVLVAAKRKLKVWHYASPFFLFGSLLGAVMGYVALILYSVQASTGACTTGLWLLLLGMALLLGNVFAKTFRTWRLFSNKRLQGLRLRDIDILPIALVVVGLAAVILIVWTVMDAPTATLTTAGLGDLEYAYICDSPDDGLAFFITTVCYFGALLLVALFLSFNTRNAGEAFNESKTLSLVVYNLTQVLIIVLVAVLAIDDPTGRYVLVTIALMFGITVTVGLLFLPKVWITIKGRGDEVAVSRFAKATAHKNRTRSGTTPGSTTSTPSNNLDPRAELNTVVTQIFDSSEV